MKVAGAFNAICREHFNQLCYAGRLQFDVSVRRRYFGACVPRPLQALERIT
jgi:hypothetical protein